jgi:hypothetical protein
MGGISRFFDYLFSIISAASPLLTTENQDFTVLGLLSLKERENTKKVMPGTFNENSTGCLKMIYFLRAATQMLI